MAWLLAGVLLALALILGGMVLAFTDVLVLEGLGAVFFWLGLMAILVGLVLVVALALRVFLFERNGNRYRRLT